MRAYDPNLPLFSIHVPKCGGTSLRNTLQKWFGAHLYFHYDDPKTQTPPPHLDLTKGLSWKRRLAGKTYPRHICVHGHFNHRIGQGIQDYYPDAKQFVTIVREPFDLAVSNYFYAKSLGSNFYVNGAPRDITTLYSGISDYVDRVVLKKPSMMLNFMPFDWDPATYELDLRRCFIHIGITEDMTNSIRQLARYLGFHAPEITHKNKSEWDEPVPEDARAEYRKQNPMAYALYDFARAHYMD